MKKNPLCELFGYPIINTDKLATHFRNSKLCPYNNISANCTKDKAQNPLGVCSIFSGDEIAITCPVRFRQDWIIASDAASFFFKEGTSWTSLTEIRIKDANGKSAGNIDLVLVSYNGNGEITDFGAVEIQGVYISGNIRQPFESYMNNNMSPEFTWDVNYNYPKADYLSSSRKRLVPQLMFKGGILNSWDKKIGVVIHESFFGTLPTMRKVDKNSADIVWLVYGLDFNESTCCYNLVKRQEIYTKFNDALNTLSIPIPGSIDDFIRILQEKLDEKLENQTAPVNETLNLFMGEED